MGRTVLGIPVSLWLKALAIGLFFSALQVLLLVTVS
jgi:hypothetical protein